MPSTVRPYGSWTSPISSDLIVSRTVRLSEVHWDGDDVYWVEMRPWESGRSVIVRYGPDGVPVDVTPAGFNARTRVHEYGGGALTVRDGVVYFSHFDDGRLYRQQAGGQPNAITPEGPFRYADIVVDATRSRLIGVREDHSSVPPTNSLVAVDSQGRGEPAVLAAGNDFYSSPAVSPDGSQLAWLTWNHPNMPWDGTELWQAELAADGSLHQPRQVAGGPEESIFQPSWSRAGVLHFVSERTGWWNLYRWSNGTSRSLGAMEAELGRPQWVFGLSTYAHLADESIVFAACQNGLWSLYRLEPTGEPRRIETSHTDIGYVRAAGDRIAFTGGCADSPAGVMTLDVRTGAITVLRREANVDLDPKYLSPPQPITFATEGGERAHALYYAPRNLDFQGPSNERPPLLVRSHGGPTSAASASLDLSIQYWTSRGLAVVDVNYGGSTGYGRQYRRRLDGQWGIVDVDDCCHAARHLVEKGLADPKRLAIRGGSAGGYTTLAALTFRQVFHAGASYYGISDLAALARETHKFESRYLDRLIGPYPQRDDLYRERSPLHFADRLNCPVIFFQGMEDKIVLPNQAERMVQALRARHTPTAYRAFEGEQHGFRRAQTIKRCLEAELAFYARVFGFEPADRLEPLDLEDPR